MSKHTKGPWEWSTSNSWRRLSAGGKDGNVMYPTTDRHDRHPNLEFPNGGYEGPDARLIAAAPTMLSALLAVQALFAPESGYQICIRGPWSDGMKAAPDAIDATFVQVAAALRAAGEKA